jgi:hypothetical protein
MVTSGRWSGIPSWSWRTGSGCRRPRAAALRRMGAGPADSELVQGSEACSATSLRAGSRVMAASHSSVRAGACVLLLTLFGCSAQLARGGDPVLGCYHLEFQDLGPLPDSGRQSVTVRLDLLVDQRTGDVERRVVRGSLPLRQRAEAVEHPFPRFPASWLEQGDTIVIQMGSGFEDYTLAFDHRHANALRGRISHWTDYAGTFEAELTGRRVRCNAVSWHHVHAIF